MGLVANLDGLANTIEVGTVGCMNRNVLKYLVIVLMVLDHISYFMNPNDPLVFPFTFVSRLTALIMCFFIAEGYFYTRNVHSYLKRLFIFALISYIPYSFAFTGHILPISVVQGYVVPHFGVNLGAFIEQVSYHIFLNAYNVTVIFVENSMIFSLFLGLLSIYLWDRVEMASWMKVLLTIGIMYAASFSDYSYFAVLYCLIFYFLKEKPAFKCIAFSIVSLLYIFNVCLLDPFTFTWTYGFDPYKIGVFLTPFLLMFYNGEPGKKSSFHKWFFYIFYPGHLIVIGLIGTYMGAFV